MDTHDRDLEQLFSLNKNDIRTIVEDVNTVVMHLYSIGLLKPVNDVIRYEDAITFDEVYEILDLKTRMHGPPPVQIWQIYCNNIDLLANT